jgi:hypothetical protein
MEKYSKTNKQTNIHFVLSKSDGDEVTLTLSKNPTIHQLPELKASIQAMSQKQGWMEGAMLRLVGLVLILLLALLWLRVHFLNDRLQIWEGWYIQIRLYH